VGGAGLLLAVLASSAVAAEDRGPLELPLSFDPVLLLQPRLVFRAEDRGSAEEREIAASLHRAEIGFSLSGGAVVAAFTADVSSGKPFLRDAYVDIGFLEGTVTARAGFVRPPLGREVLAAGDRHTLPAEPLSLAVVDPQRELGLELHGRVAGILSYAVGAWSGIAEGIDGTPGAGELQVLAGGRLAVEPFGALPAEEGASDLRGGGTRAAFAAAGLFGRREGVPFPGRAGPGATYGEDRLRAGGEAAFQWKGLSAVAEFFWSSAWASPGTSTALERRLPRVDGIGGYLQLAGFVIPRRLELAARCEAWDEDVEIAGALLAPMAGVSFHVIPSRVVFRLGYRVRFALDEPFPDESPYAEPITHDVMAMLQLSL
jgi:hypothetical protein